MKSFKKLDKLFSKELNLLLDYFQSDKVLVEDIRKNFDLKSAFNVEYRLYTRWDVTDFADRFENWCERSGMLVKEKINVYNRRYIVRK
jgi:hypothetical protein